MSEADRVEFSRRERFLKNVAVLAVRLIYRSVEVRQQPGESSSGPQLAVSNHFGGVADALIQAYALDRVPRFVARDVIWRYPLAKQVMGFVRAIPTHKPEDEGPAGNDQMFRSTYDALHERDLIMIFPEGITVEDPSMARIKTGAARIALGARADGVEGIEIVPSGIHYDDKGTLRSRVWVNVGAPINIDEEMGRYASPGDAQDASNRDAVRALTADIEENLRRSAPDYSDWEEERALSMAAQIALRSLPGAPTSVDFGDESALANTLSGRDHGAKAPIVGAVDRYTAELEAIGLSDRKMVDSHRDRAPFLLHLLANLAIGILLLPFALVGLAINLIPFALIWLIGRAKLGPAVAATVKPLASIVLFSATWAIIAWQWSDVGGIIAMLLLMPLYIFAVFALYERATLVIRAWKGFWGTRRSDPYEVLFEHRRAVVEAVVDAL
ncbi:MAG: 1-acyl-sn-glycerol-3-phosphate acyltransferase [Actinomycetota bacterium]